jgi:hypothetical protein
MLQSYARIFRNSQMPNLNLNGLGARLGGNTGASQLQKKDAGSCPLLLCDFFNQVLLEKSDTNRCMFHMTSSQGMHCDQK